MTEAAEILEWLAEPGDIAAWLGYRAGFKAGHEDELRWKRESYSEQYVQGYRYGVAARQLLK